ncbi:hypothetical protein GOP47_0018032 [Adiantum capillus-veneris]|uniref:Uncharacterized protein n=1 Tax=Adiantum capillus-veneris TaxID=13818 RepID=A0A9D4UGK0_ADICA|nr:hypothetical protein GOP47_0018032 [Adiantum capillus-veneris]
MASLPPKNSFEEFFSARPALLVGNTKPLFNPPSENNSLLSRELSFGQDSISPLSSQSRSYCGSNLASAVTQGGPPSSQQLDNTQPSQQRVNSGSTFPQSSQRHNSSDSQSISVYHTSHTQDVANHDSVHNMKFANCAQPVQHDNCIAPSLTCAQRACMAQEKDTTLARRKEKQCQQQVHQNHSRSSMSQCTLADGDILYVGDLQHDEFVGSSYSQVSGCGLDGSFLTSDQRARMAQEKEKALARRMQKLQQLQQASERWCDDSHLTSNQNHSRSSMSQSTLGDGDIRHDDFVGSSYSQAWGCGLNGSSLTSDQRARMAREKEKALARRKQKLQQLQQASERGCDDSPLTSDQRARMAQEKEKALAKRKQKLQQLQQSQDQCHNKRGCDDSPLTSDRRARMAQEKEKALAKRKQKLQQLQQSQDQCHNKSSISRCSVADGHVYHVGDSQDDGCVRSHSSLTSEQRVRMAQKKEKALARRRQKLHQQQQAQEQNDRNFSSSQCTTTDGCLYDVEYGSLCAQHGGPALVHACSPIAGMAMQCTVGNEVFLDSAGCPSQSSSQIDVQLSNTQSEQECNRWGGPQYFFPMEAQNLVEQDAMCGSTLDK